MSNLNQTPAGSITAAHAQWIILLLGAILATQIVALLIVLL